MLAVLAGTGVLRGLQDTRTPLLVAVVANALNIGAQRDARARPALGHRRIGRRHRDRADRLGRRLPGRGRPRGACRRDRPAAGPRRHQVGGVRRRVTGAADASAPGGAGAHDRDRGPAVGRRRSPPTRSPCGSGTCSSSRSTRSRSPAQAITGRQLGSGDVAGARAATTRMIGWGAGYGALFSVVLLAIRPVLPGLFGVSPAGTRPAAGRPAHRDRAAAGRRRGVRARRRAHRRGRPGLPGHGRAGHACRVRVPRPPIVVRTGGGLVALWVAYAAWMLARLATLTLRTRSSRWLVIGAVRH